MRDSHSYGAPPIFERAVVARVPRRRLSRPLPLKGGGVLPTVGEAANYVVTLDQAEHCNRWRRATGSCSSRPTSPRSAGRFT